MNTEPRSFQPIPSIDQQVDDLLASSANLVETPFDVDDNWGEVTREYDLKAFLFPPEIPVDARTTHETLKDARTGLDLFLNESCVALATGHADLTEHQRVHLAKIVTFIEALSSRFDKVMRQK